MGTQENVPKSYPCGYSALFLQVARKLTNPATVRSRKRFRPRCFAQGRNCFSKSPGCRKQTADLVRLRELCRTESTNRSANPSDWSKRGLRRGQTPAPWQSFQQRFHIVPRRHTLRQD